MKRGYQAISRAVPYVSDAVAGYLTDGVAGAVARPAARAARELLPDAFTNNRAKRRAGIPIDLLFRVVSSATSPSTRSTVIRSRPAVMLLSLLLLGHSRR